MRRFRDKLRARLTGPDRWQGHGIGKALLVHLAQRAVAEGCARVEWSVLDWNTPSIGFYQSLGAKLMDEWTVMRPAGPPPLP